MLKIPTDTGGRFSQPNNSDKFGSLAYTKNINLDEEGYIKLSPRTVTIADQAANVAAGNGDDFGVPVFIGRFNAGEYLVGTSDSVFDIQIFSNNLLQIENTGTNNPQMTTDSNACWWQNRFYSSDDTAVLYRTPTVGGEAGASWTSAITGLTSGVRHYLKVFSSRQQLCVTNGNVVKQYDTTHAGTVDLTIPADNEIAGIAYNKSKMGIITRIGGATTSQDEESKFYIWDGTTTGAGDGVGIGASAGVAICAYKSSFVILTKSGRLLYWNGGGFTDLAAFPFYFEDKIWGAPLSNLTLGDSMMADGDVIYVNVGLELNSFNRKQETITPNCPSGVWCFDPKVGLYHRWSPSISHAYNHNLIGSDINTTTDVFTTAYTLPATGNIARLLRDLAGVTGISLNQDYYIIKVSSTTFKLATTKANALASTAIDITAVTTGANAVNFWMYDLVDYGNSFHGVGSAGAIGLTDETLALYRDVLFGGDYGTTTLTANDALCLTIPFLENRGYFVTPKIFSSQVTDNNQKLFVKFRPLKTTDSIIVKYRDRDIVGLPVTSSGDEANWTSPSEFYTAQDLSEAKTYLDAGGELECEFISGAGGGTMVKVSSISAPDSTNTSVVLAEEVLGAASTLKAEFIIHNWKTLRTIASTDSDHDSGVAVIPIGGASKFVQFKVEMRGSDVTIEEIGIINNTNKKAE